MSAFAAAARALMADPNLGSDAVYQPAAGGPPVALRAILSAPDQLADLGTARLVSPSHVADVLVASLPCWAEGDRLTIGGESWRVQHGERDATRLFWRLQVTPIRPAAEGLERLAAEAGI